MYSHVYIQNRIQKEKYVSAGGQNKREELGLTNILEDF